MIGFHTPTILNVKPGARLSGEVGGMHGPELPGDKSLSHRAALLGAMAEGTSEIKNLLVSGVTQAMLDALTSLEVPWTLDGNTLTVSGIGLEPRWKARPLVIQCGNSATTLRLLAGALAAWNCPAALDGSPGLRRRPMGRIIAPLRMMGVRIDGVEDCAPLTIQSLTRPLLPLQYMMPVASAQVKSCLLLAALAAKSKTKILEPGPSRDHTERMLQAMGVTITNGSDEVSDEVSGSRASYWTLLHPPDPLRLSPLNLIIPGDMSAAAFLMVAALITPGSQISLKRVGINPTRTGLLETLQEMGADIHVINQSEQSGEPVGDLIIRSSSLRGVQVNGERVVRMIDEFPAFAAAAAYSEGPTIVSDAEELRHKESDRISALGEELRNIGVDFQETFDGFVIHGGKRVKGGVVQSHGDHRLAMSLALIGLAAEAPVVVNGAEIIQESFPSFVEMLQFLGANLESDQAGPLLHPSR